MRFFVNLMEVEMDEIQKLELENQGRYTVGQFADKVAIMSEENVRRYLRQSPEFYPDHWKDLGVRAYKINKRDWVIEIAAKPDELAAGYAVRTLPPAAADALQKIRDLVCAFEQRLPIAKVVSVCEEQLPFEEAAGQLKQFIKQAPPPDKVLNELSRTFIRK